MVTEEEQSAVVGGGKRSVLECVGLSKVFRDFWMRNRVHAVDGVTFSAQQGEVLGLLGPNGSGKSTTIKLILGLLYPTAGRVLVFGKDPGNVGVKRRIGYLPEESYLYRFLNARETLDYYGRLFGLSKSQREGRTDMLLEMVGLTAVQRRPVGEYSKGMQRRIGLAQALVNDPDLLILDEPTAGLDPIGSRQIKDLIVELSRRGKTVLLCSHLLGDVQDVCDRVAIMFGGRIRKMGRVDDLLVRQGVTTLVTPHLDVETIQAIESLLQERGKHIEKVDQPRQKLETLFLDIVNQAHEQGVRTSGVQRAGRIAAFLRAEGVSTGPDLGRPLPDRASPGSGGGQEDRGEGIGEADAGLIESLSGQWQSKSEQTMVGRPVDVSGLEGDGGGATGLSHATDLAVERSVLEELTGTGGGGGQASGEGHEDGADAVAAEGGRDEQGVADAGSGDVGHSTGVVSEVSEGSVEPSSGSGDGGVGGVGAAGGEDEAPDKSFLDALAGVEPYQEPDESGEDQSERQGGDGSCDGLSGVEGI